MKILFVTLLLFIYCNFCFCISQNHFNKNGDEKSIHFDVKSLGSSNDNPALCGTPNSQQLEQYINGLVGSYGYCNGTEWAVTDFKTFNIQSSNSQNPQQTASTIKLWVLLSVFKDIEAGLYTLDKQIECSTGLITVEQCIALMIGVSDNCATYSLTALTKLSSVNALFKTLGMDDSQFHEWCFTTCLGYSSPCPNNDGTGDNNVLSSHDVIHGLTLLHEGQILNETFTALTYKFLLTAHGWQPMLGYYVPAPVAHKQGWLPANEGFNPFTENDEATVFSECGDYAASVMITRDWSNPQEDTIALQLGATIGKYIYCTMVPFGYTNDGAPCSITLSQQIPSPACQ
ncbi:hypothetical protein DICPUDRAFT_155952 [Dictyostelium purpureum]|uniref:Beta-lactamase class A catalytic domain-containing protein n=1 Tax=Dictyostelium purpureum TaxID=5786 RepID=F0ZVB4_DICPU|nr:uncharacterized protein DICPUDRAFT_155952 [Dictyostelium purpureum]EGC32115.1 hypothetical protein DICPUDRAFT_155952 [Dictyostelium purpureum]|eukprot:XP_003291365.1 hypothetical protein DICPUDRAFT_155952 [Dictyostelium purpureum]